MTRGEDEERAAGGTAPVLHYSFFVVTLDTASHSDETGGALTAGRADDGSSKGNILPRIALLPTFM